MSHKEYLKAFDQYIDYAEANGYQWLSFPLWKDMYNCYQLGITH